LNFNSGLPRIIMNERLASWTGAVFFTLWIGQRFYFQYHASFLWWLITFQFILFVAAYLVRRQALEHAKGFMEIIFPFICAAMPFALENYPFKPRSTPLAGFEPWYVGLMIAGTVVIILGVFSLRRSFSIMAEVREPVYNGIYRLTRHPMYLGSMISSAGLFLYYFSFLNIFIFIIFAACQFIRAGLEEKKIAAVFPEYARYAGRVGWVWKIGRRSL